MSDLSESDERLLKDIGKTICEFTEGNPYATMMVQKISLALGIDKDEIFRVARLATERGLLEAPTANQLKLGKFGVNYFCN
jgi:hypothetical protein